MKPSAVTPTRSRLVSQTERAGWVLLRISVVPLVFFTVASALFAVFHVAAILIHAVVKAAGRLGTLLEGALLVVAFVVSICGGLLACRAFWRGTSHQR